MHLSEENSRKRENDSDKRGEYRKFDEASSRMTGTRWNETKHRTSPCWSIP